MKDVALFHSVYGLRPAVLETAEVLRAAGHRVVTPDLYGGPVARTIDEGFALSESVGWETILERARQALRALDPDAVLAGLSMGVGVAGAMLAERPGTAGLLLLHGVGGEPRDRLPVQVHVGAADAMFPPAAVTAWRDAAGGAVQVYEYAGAAHFFTDPGVHDFNRPAAELAWQRARRFLANL
jgi:dienelactone hydrolase